MTKTRKIIGWVLTGLLGAFLLMSVMGKLTSAEMQAGMTGWGLEDWIEIIAIGELIAVLLFIIPRTNLFGVFLLSSHLGGAIVVHMSHAEPFIVPAILLIAVWCTAFIRNPKLVEIIKGQA